MVQTAEGAKKAIKTMIKRYGNDYFARIGKIGGEKGHTGGFAGDPERARILGSIGGKISRRGKAKTIKQEGNEREISDEV